MSVEIREVRTRTELRKFVAFPETLYADERNWTPSFLFDDMNTLNPKKNPAFEFCEAQCWTAWKEGRMAGRIAGIINHRFVEKWGKKFARFGWIDFIDDFEVASVLVKTVEDWARAKGMEGLHGPWGFTDLDREGMLVEGFGEQATFATIYNYPYYPSFMERLGYAKEVDWVEFRVTTPESIPEKVLRVNELLSKRAGVRIYEWKTRKELKTKFGAQVFELIDEAYAGLYGTTPLSPRQVQAYIDQYLNFVDPRFTKIMVDSQERLAGFAITIPSLSDALYKSRGRLFPFGWARLLAALRTPKSLDMMLVAVRKEYLARGTVALLMTALNKSAIENSIKESETNPELETNLAVQGIWKDYPKRQHKRRRVFFKAL